MLVGLTEMICCALCIVTPKRFGSKLYRYFDEMGFGPTMGAIAWITLCLTVYISGNQTEGMLTVCIWILAFLVLFLLLYDLDAVQCFYNPWSAFFRSTGLTRHDILFDDGLLGEFYAYVLSKKLKVEHRALFNVCVPMPNGNFQEVDAIIITEHVMYVIECKNRNGLFSGHINGDTWVQELGNEKHAVKNIYEQNQEHITAIEYFLESKGIVDIQTRVCVNVILNTGYTRFNIEGNAFWLWGEVDYVKNEIMNAEKNNIFEQKPDKSFIYRTYAALLPYSLNSEDKKKEMLAEREARALNKEFSRGRRRTFLFPDGIRGVADEEDDKNVLLKVDKQFTSLGLHVGDGTYLWASRPDIEYIPRD